MAAGSFKCVSEDDLIASFSFLNEPPPHERPGSFHLHLMPELVALCQAGREFLCTDVFSERFRDMICVSIPPPPGTSGAAPEIYHDTLNEKFSLSVERPRWVRETLRERFEKLQANKLDRLRYFIGKYKEFILRDMCEKEAHRRYVLTFLSKKSDEQSDVPDDRFYEMPTVIERPTSVKWHFFHMTRSSSPEPTVQFVYEDPLSPPGTDETLIASLKLMARSRPTPRRQPEESEGGILSERWRGDIQKVAGSSYQADGLRQDLETPPEVSISPHVGIPPNELLTLDEEERRIASENRNNELYRRDNETFAHKKSLLRRFMEDHAAAAAEKDEDESSSDDSSYPRSTSDYSGSSSSTNPYERFRELEKTEEFRIARENERAEQRYRELIENHKRHIETLEDFAHIFCWRYSKHPNFGKSVTSMIDCIEEEKEVLRSFRRNHPSNRPRPGPVPIVTFSSF